MEAHARRGRGRGCACSRVRPRSQGRACFASSFRRLTMASRTAGAHWASQKASIRSHTSAASSRAPAGSLSTSVARAAVVFHGPTIPSQPPSPSSSSGGPSVGSASRAAAASSSVATSACTRSQLSCASSVAKTPTSTSAPRPTSRMMSREPSSVSPSMIDLRARARARVPRACHAREPEARTDACAHGCVHTEGDGARARAPCGAVHFEKTPRYESRR